jgi:hypothetical protein
MRPLMRRCAVGHLLLLAALATLGGCTARETATPVKHTELAQRIERLVETFLTSDDAKEASVLSDARGIFEREGIPTVAKVGDAAAYGFVLVNMLGQPPEFQAKFLEGVRDAATRKELSEDTVAFAEARFRQTEVEERYKTSLPSNPELRDQISRLYKADQAVREREGFDARKMMDADRRTADPLKTIFNRYGVPTYDMVGVQAAKNFAVMVQHQPAEFRREVLPKLKANVDVGQADPATYAQVYDRSQRDQGKNQLYGEQLECTSGKVLEEAPIDDEANVNLRRAELGLMRVEIYARLVRSHSPEMCGPVTSKK